MYTESLASELHILWPDRDFRVQPMIVDLSSTFLVVEDDDRASAIVDNKASVFHAKSPTRNALPCLQMP